MSEKGSGPMRTQTDEIAVAGVGPREAIPEMRPWREVGWIFRDGDAYVVERQGERTRARVARVSETRDE